MLRRILAAIAVLTYAIPAPVFAQTTNAVARDPDAPPPTPFALSDRWSLGLTAQFDSHIHIDADIDSSIDGDVFDVRPQAQLALLYEVPNTVRYFFSAKINHSVAINEGAVTEHRELQAELDELYLRWLPFQGGVVSVGRSRMNDPRNWIFGSSDDKNDNIQLQYRVDRDFLQVVAVTRDLLPSNLFEPESRYRTLNYAATYEHTLVDGISIGGFLLLQDRRNEGGGLDRAYYGVRSRGSLAEGHFDYWADTIVLRGMSGTTPMRSYAFDIGAMYNFLDPLRFHVVGGYAYGSGDDDPSDGIDKRFRQTGIQENRYHFGGVSRFKYYGESINPELSNLGVATAAVGFKPNVLSSLDLVVHHYELAQRGNGLIASRLSRQPTGYSRNVGNAADIVVGYRNRAGAEYEFFGGWFMPGPAFGSFRTNSVYGMLKLKYNFGP